MHQFAHQIFHITADVTGLAELGRIRLDERNPDQVGNVFDQICLPDTSRADKNNVLLGVFGFICAGHSLLQPPYIIDVVVMIADRDR